jgi:hypothetical protein
VEVGGAVVLVSRVVDGSTVVGASVVDSAVVLGSSEVVVGSALVEVDEAFVDEVVGAVEIWETWTVFVDVPEVAEGEVAEGEVAVGSPMLRVASPSESSPLLSEPPAMVKGFEDWKNPSESESSRSLMP